MQEERGTAAGWAMLLLALLLLLLALILRHGSLSRTRPPFASSGSMPAEERGPGSPTAAGQGSLASPQLPPPPPALAREGLRAHDVAAVPAPASSGPRSQAGPATSPGAENLASGASGAGAPSRHETAGGLGGAAGRGPAEARAAAGTGLRAAQTAGATRKTAATPGQRRATAESATPTEGGATASGALPQASRPASSAPMPGERQPRSPGDRRHGFDGISAGSFQGGAGGDSSAASGGAEGGPSGAGAAMGSLASMAGGPAAGAPTATPKAEAAPKVNLTPFEPQHGAPVAANTATLRAETSDRFALRPGGPRVIPVEDVYIEKAAKADAADVSGGPRPAPGPTKERSDNPNAPAAERLTSKADIDADGAGDAWRRDATGQGRTSLRYRDGGSLDPTKIPFFVLPGDYGQRHKARLGDYAVVTYQGKSAYAIAGDIGPRGVFGEISMVLAATLGINPKPNGGTKSPSVRYLILPGTADSEPARDAATIQQRGAEKLAARGFALDGQANN